MKKPFVLKAWRRKNRRREVRLRRIRFLFRSVTVLGVAAALFFAGGELASRSRFFTLEEIKVSGQFHKLNADQIKEFINLPLGINLFKIDLKDLTQKLTAKADFKSILISRKLPHHLEIAVEEYQPKMILASAGKYFYLDAEGIAYKEITNSADSRDYPFLTGISGSESQPSVSMFDTQQVIADAVNLVKIYETMKLDATLPISELHFDKNNGFTLYPEGKKYSIKLGDKDFENKLKKLSDVLVKLSYSQDKISLVDLNYTGKILVKM